MDIEGKLSHNEANEASYLNSAHADVKSDHPALTNGSQARELLLSDFIRVDAIGEGTDGVVFRARDKRSSEMVAIKQLRTQEDDFPETVEREISILKSVSHPNIIAVRGIARNEDPEFWYEMYMVMEYAEQDLANLIDNVGIQFSLGEVKCLFRQLLEGLEYLHERKFIHRDIKMPNLLLSAKGVLKIADFGMARPYSHEGPVTPGVVTIWYRSPELLLGTFNYTTSVDMWAAGLILAELLVSEALLQGQIELEQLALVVKVLGAPSAGDIEALADMGCPELVSWRERKQFEETTGNLAKRFPAWVTTETVEFLPGMLTWDPVTRWTASEALGKTDDRHGERARRWWNESPAEVKRDCLPSFPEMQPLVVGGSNMIDWDSEPGEPG